MRERPAWDEYFMMLAFWAATRSTCKRRQVGAALVRDRHVLATGYNGAPKGVEDCLSLGCLRDAVGIPSGTMHEVCRATHAEANAIAQAASFGVSVKGSTLYGTHSPCGLCARLLINAGIRQVYYAGSYPDMEALKLLEEAQVGAARFELMPMRWQSDGHGPARLERGWEGFVPEGCRSAYGAEGSEFARFDNREEAVVCRLCNRKLWAGKFLTVSFDGEPRLFCCIPHYRKFFETQIIGNEAYFLMGRPGNQEELYQEWLKNSPEIADDPDCVGDSVAWITEDIQVTLKEPGEPESEGAYRSQTVISEGEADDSHSL